SGNAVTITFVVPQSDPSFRVWGMNDDDMASVSVNGAAYPLNGTSASYDPKVVCGLSPGNDGVVFSGGNLVGANNNTEGNYSYQDIILQTNGVNTITITGISGLGWGFAGVTVNCVTGLDPQQSHIAERFLVSPNPLRSTAVIQWNMTVSNARIDMFDHIGKLVRSEYNVSGNNFRLDCNGLPNGIYIVRLSEGNTVIASERLVVTD
ncbi:MAG: T9SS type A sorting domain-containing protein, partial [Flavobacteriales bacterium]|nr:T9SS type A sorting domain-containing protein [Flavobacteriales bacterium]